MKKHKDEAINFAELVVGIFWGIFLGWMLALYWWKKTTPVDVWEIATAIGTVGTAGIATYLSYREAFKRNRTERLAAEIAHSRIAPELRQLRVALSAAVWAARKLALVEENEHRDVGALYQVSRLKDGLALPICAQKCDLLLPAEAELARKVSGILAEAVKVNASVTTVVGFGDSQPNGGGITTFILLERICELGALVDDYLGVDSSREFQLETHRSIARHLEIEEIFAKRFA
ncbi:hypothetical protein [Achromobacter animicus]|uniref:hypothetical protein n=1 Tax=Achromobacter animicus TaxID=1389935 RepID=UPI0028ABE2C2|nr:hypothetical protein [Achromobacter animicus]